MPSAEEAMSLADTWNRIVAWHEANTRPGRFQLNSGASPTAIADFERAIGAMLPDDFRKSLLLHDGGNESCWILWYGELLSLDAMLKQWTMYRDWQMRGEYAVPESDDWTARAVDGPIKPEFWNIHRLFVTDNCGDHLTLDFDPPPKGNYGQVFHHSHEVGPETVLAPSWSAFLNQLADDLHAGKYVYAKEEDTVALPGMYD
jgi:cell wall assembly regulator SMI1